MKKSLIALAVLGVTGLGFSGAAMAQSSVTMYGVADAGIGKAKSDGDTRVHMISGNTMNNGTSRLGVRGVEDLGGGLKAGFNFETGLNLTNGSTSTAGAGYWGRAANLWLGGNWGTFKMGRTLNPSFYGTAAWELTGVANYSVIANTYSFAGSGSRNNSQFSYKTPDFNGFSAELGYIFKDDNGGNNKIDANVIYANGPIGVGLSVNKTQTMKTNYALGGKYSFGQFAVAASYSANNNVGGISTNKRRGFSLGGSFNTGPFTATLDLTRDTTVKAGGVNGKKYTNGVLEGKYALSKRTFVYAAYLRFDGDNNYGIGVRHNF